MKRVVRAIAAVSASAVLLWAGITPASAASAAQILAAAPVAVAAPVPANLPLPSDLPLPAYAVKIVPGSVIHLVSRSSMLPISIQNDFPVNIRVQVHVAANSLSALIPSAVEVNVPANTTYVAQVPVTAIADGPVQLRAWLTSFSGISLGAPVDLNLVINAEIEESLVTGFVIVVVGLGVAGILRTRTKRRRQREAS
ncbi:MAG: hypothetical protein RJA35_958 [Actinomycetota bacterium]